MLHDRPVIPQSLHTNVLEHLHAGHASATAMFERAATSFYWPNFRADMINFRASCTTCTKYAPSNPSMPPTEPEQPIYPFQSVCADFFHISPNNYLALVDRYTGWLSISKLPTDSSEELVKVLRDYIATFGIPSTLTTDGAKVFTSKLVEDFCSRWGIVHRVATAYNPRANKRAEVGVKSAKRLIRGNITQTGSLQTDKLARALLAHRNTPCPVTGLSPAQIVFGRVLRDFLPLQPGKFQPRQEWRQAADARATAYAKRHFLKAEQLTRGSKNLPPLKPGDQVAIQAQHGNNPKQWPHTGVVVEVGPHHSYFVSIDGSRTITKRNRQFLRKFVPFSPDKPTATTPRPSITSPKHASVAPPTSAPTRSPEGSQVTVTPSAPVPTVSRDHLPQQNTQERFADHPEHAVPDEQPTHVEPDDHTSQYQTKPLPPPKPKPTLPPHLRERWVVAEPEPEPLKPIRLSRGADGNYTVVQNGSVAPLAFQLPFTPFRSTNPSTMASMSPIQSYSWNNPMTMMNVANNIPNQLHYMMPQQHSNPIYQYQYN